MNCRIRFPGILAASSAVFLLSFTVVHAGKPNKPEGPSYTILPLDRDVAGLTVDQVEPWDINEARVIVGQVTLSGPSDIRAAYWTAGNDLGLLNGNGQTASGLNDSNEIVGWGFHPDDGRQVGFYWASPTADPSFLLLLADDDRCSAWAVNNQGVICGRSKRDIYNGDQILVKRESRAVVWKVTEGGVEGPFELPNYLDVGLSVDPDEGYGHAGAINDNDEDGVATVVGHFWSCYDVTFNAIAAVSWSVSFESTNEGTLQLVAIPTILDLDAFTSGVSSAGAICGTLKGSTSADDQAVVWTETSRTTLSGLPSVSYETAVDIENGVIVGFGWYEGRKTQGDRAVVWPSATGEMILLDNFLGKRSSLVHSTSAIAINHAGEIVGGATGGAFLAIPK